MNPITNPVVNSRAADTHYDNVRNQHTDILTGMKEQSLRVADYNAQRAEQTNQVAMESKKMEQDSKTEQMKLQNERMQLDMKQQELEIKRMALNSNE